MTVLDYFLNKNTVAGIDMPDSQAEVFIISHGMVSTDPVLPTISKEVDIAWLASVALILVRPDISEDDYSIKFDRASVLKFYHLESARLGIENEFLSTVVDKSYLA